MLDIHCIDELVCVDVFLNTGFEKSQPVNIPDAVKKKKKKRIRASDSSTGTFEGNERQLSLRKKNVIVLLQ